MSKQPEAKISVKILNDEFKKGAQELQKESQMISKEFKLQSEQMKLTASETEKLEARLEFLKDKQDNARKSVENAQTAYDKAVELFGENSKAADDLGKKLLDARIEEQKFTNEVQQANKKLDEQQKEAKETTKKFEEIGKAAKETGEKLQDVGGKMSDLGGKMTATVTAPLAGAAGVLLKSAADAEEAIQKMSAQLNLSAKETEKFGKVAKDIWAGAYGDSIEEVTESLAIVKQNIRDINDEDLQRITENAFILSDAFGVDIRDSTATASVMMQTFGIDAEKAMDLMTVGFQNGGDYSGELLDTLKEYSPQFEAMGMSAEDMVNILISGVEAGAFSLDKVGDAVKEFNIRAKDGSDATAEAFEAVGLKADEMAQAIAEGGEKGERAFQATVAGIASIEDPIERNKVGVALFGTQWEDLESKVVTAMTSSVDHLGELEGATQKTGDIMYDNFNTRMTEAFRNFSLQLEPLGLMLLEMAEVHLPKIIDKVTEFVEYFKEMSPAMQNFTLIMGGVVALLGPLMFFIGSLVSGIGGIVKAVMWSLPFLAKLAPLFNGLRVVLGLLLSPIGLIVAGVAYMAYKIYENWDAIKAKTEEVFTKVSAFLGEVWKVIKLKAADFVADMVSRFISFKDKAKAIFDAFGNVIKNSITNAKNAVMNIISNLVSQGVDKFSNMKNRVEGIFDSIKSVASNIFGGIKTAITKPIESARDTVLGIIGKIKDGFLNMKITIPKPKLPRVSVSMGSRNFMGVDIPVPNFDIKWFKTGGVFNKPAVFGNAGFGDVAEAIVPFEGSHADRIAGLIAEAQSRLAKASDVIATRQPTILNANLYLDGELVAENQYYYLNGKTVNDTNIGQVMRG